ncbi:large ribosomal subunit protein eL36-like [Erinaceus europaeus]|uniref:Large ribosomal subunit protein eL36 n=1 Tax=Erinaceus europaeus TaxID=9365 RepID=A0ABM3WS41_ERIEU|nr:large ribosomal subunit protein eL36-like [Erinaceus europaeus]
MAKNSAFIGLHEANEQISSVLTVANKSFDNCTGNSQSRAASITMFYHIAISLNKGHKVTKNVSLWKHSYCCGQVTKHTKFKWDMMPKVCSFTPYECHAMELLKLFKDKHGLKFIKKQLEGSLQLAALLRTQARQLSDKESS